MKNTQFRSRKSISKKVSKISLIFSVLNSALAIIEYQTLTLMQLYVNLGRKVAPFTNTIKENYCIAISDADFHAILV